MANPSHQTALQKAMSGARLTDGQTRRALTSSLGKLKEMTSRVAQTKGAIQAAGKRALHLGETTLTLAGASLIEGYVGTEKMKLGPVDLRLPVGGVGVGYGIFNSVSTEPDAVGDHALALGTGVIGSAVSSAAYRWGQNLAQRRAEAKNSQAGGGQYDAAPPADVNTLPVPVTLTPSSVQGLLPPPPLEVPPVGAPPMREVLLTPSSDDFEGLEADDFEGPRRASARGVRGGRGGSHSVRRTVRVRGRNQTSRFVRAGRDDRRRSVDPGAVVSACEDLLDDLD